jgi:hypothetical protein
MKQLTNKLLFILLLYPIIVFAQVEVAITTLTLNPGSQSFGMGGAGVSVPSSDPFSFFNNPALLGYSAQTNNISTQFYPLKYFRNDSDIPTFTNSGFSAGYNFGKILNSLNLSGGVGFITSNYDYGMSSAYVDMPEFGKEISYNKYNAFGIGVSLDYLINLSFGFTVKYIDSKLTPQPGLTVAPHGESKLNAIDWGLLLTVPISRLAFNDLAYKPYVNAEIKPVVNLSLGYSRSNIGKEVLYDGYWPWNKEPLPLTAKLGYTLSLGSDLLICEHLINIFSYDISVEAEDLLVKIDNHGISYQGLLGDIKPLTNVIAGKRTGSIILRKGQRINLFETITLLYGSYYTEYIYESGNRTNGFVLSSNGVFNILSWKFDENPYLKYFLDHFEIKYINAWDVSEFLSSNDFAFKRNMQAISISFNKFTL